MLPPGLVMSVAAAVAETFDVATAMKDIDMGDNSAFALGAFA